MGYFGSTCSAVITRFVNFFYLVRFNKELCFFFFPHRNEKFYTCCDVSTWNGYVLMTRGGLEETFGAKVFVSIKNLLKFITKIRNIKDVKWVFERFNSLLKYLICNWTCLVYSNFLLFFWTRQLLIYWRYPYKRIWFQTLIFLKNIPKVFTSIKYLLKFQKRKLQKVEFGWSDKFSISFNEPNWHYSNLIIKNFSFYLSKFCLVRFDFKILPNSIEILL